MSHNDWMEASISPQAMKIIDEKNSRDEIPSIKSSESKHQEIKIPCDRWLNNHIHSSKTSTCDYFI